MSDDVEAPEVAQDTPEPGPVDSGTPEAQEVDYRTRYGDLRSEFDRRNALISRAQSGDVEAMRELGFEPYEEPEDEPEYVDPAEELRAEIKAIKDELEAGKKQRDQEKAEIASAQALSALPGVDELTPQEQEMVWQLAQTRDRLPNGQYDVESAYKAFNAAWDERLKGYTAGKKSAPRAPGGGKAATDVRPTVDMDLSEATRWAAERLNDLSQQS